MSSRAFVGSALGWSDLNFGGIFENGHIVADQVYFYESDSRNSATFAAGAAKFLFSKNHRDLKNYRNIFFENSQIPSFYLKEYGEGKNNFLKFLFGF